ncbi:hypothetical protein A2U01_0089396, partial [Trifolium medium]|nr:hypothetical protein [Trifolium medium]
AITVAHHCFNVHYSVETPRWPPYLKCGEARSSVADE